VVALLGRSGAGESTTLKSLMGLVRPRSGKVVFDGHELAGRPAHVRAVRKVDLPRPRDRSVISSQTFINLREQVWHDLFDPSTNGVRVQ
jgi:branched-chain amino acid transport system ATP-binding protein